MSNANQPTESPVARHRDELSFAMPADLEAKIRQRLSDAEASNETPAPAPILRSPLRLNRWLSLVAACLAVAVSFQIGRVSSRVDAAQQITHEIVAGHVRSLMVAHLADVISTDQHTVKPWFEGKLDFAPTVRDFAADGFPLIGGRLDYADNHVAAALVYRRAQHYINLFQWPTAGDDSPPRLITERGFQIYRWQREGLTYWAVSDINAAELQQFASLWISVDGNVKPTPATTGGVR